MASSATATQTEVNQAQSVMLMRNLMRVTFSNVVYTRGIFDSSQFKPMNARSLVMSGWPRGVSSEALSVAPVTELCSPQVGGVTVMTLYSDAPDENAKQVVEWMEEGVFKALNDNYLVRTACQRPGARAHTTHARTPRTYARTTRLSCGRTSACSSSLPMRRSR